MIKLNAVGENCPIPVIKTKKALKEHDQVEITVDNEIATQNLNKMAMQLGYLCEVQKLTDGNYNVMISKDGNIPSEVIGESNVIDSSGEYIVAISSDKMGSGEEELGKILLKGFIYALTEQDVLPKKVIFYNSGVFLALENSESLEDLKKLEAQRIEILVCGLCANYYSVTERVSVGTITNMYSILENMRMYHTVKPS